MPAYLTSDQGTQFTSALWVHTCDVIGTNHNTTTAYHPQSNSMEEKAYRQLKDKLKDTSMAAADWPQHLPWILLDINNAPKGCTPSVSRTPVGTWFREVTLGKVEVPPARLVYQGWCH